jgi:hypothetical protein
MAGFRRQFWTPPLPYVKHDCQPRVQFIGIKPTWDWARGQAPVLVVSKIRVQLSVTLLNVTYCWFNSMSVLTLEGPPNEQTGFKHLVSCSVIQFEETHAVIRDVTEKCNKLSLKWRQFRKIRQTWFQANCQGYCQRLQFAVKQVAHVCPVFLVFGFETMHHHASRRVCL